MAERLVGLSDVDDELYDFLEHIEFQWKLADLSKLKDLKDHKDGIEVLIYDGFNGDKEINIYATIKDFGLDEIDEDILDDLAETNYIQYYDDENQVLLGM